MRKINENFQKQGRINIFANFNLLRLEKKLGNYKNKVNKLTPKVYMFKRIRINNNRDREVFKNKQTRCIKGKRKRGKYGIKTES